MPFFDVTNADVYGFEPQNHLWSLFYDKYFLVIAFTCFALEFPYSFVFFFYFTRSMKIITGLRHWVLTEESPRLTTMTDNNALAVFSGYYTRSLFPLPAFLNDVVGIHSVLIKLIEIKTPVLEFFLTCIERDSLCYNIFVSSQELFCRQKPISSSKLTDPSASSGSPQSWEMTDTQPVLY